MSSGYAAALAQVRELREGNERLWADIAALVAVIERQNSVDSDDAVLVHNLRVELTKRLGDKT